MSALWPSPNKAFLASAYEVPRHPASFTLRLDGNEGPSVSDEAFKTLDLMRGEDLRTYPSASRLEAKLAERFGVNSDQVLVTAGADDGLLRMCRAFLGPGKNLIFPTPGFTMIPRFVAWTGGECIEVPWLTPCFPVEEVVGTATENTVIVCVTSPNNPTGYVVTPEDLIALSRRLPNGLLMVDEAYGEFAEQSLTETALSLPNALVFRTFSKAGGLAGLRVGYVMGPSPLLRVLRGAGVPYPVSTPSLVIAEQALQARERTEQLVREVRNAREELEQFLRLRGLKVTPSQGNFVFVRGVDGRWWRDAFASLGIGIRAWPGDPELGDALRITVTGCKQELQRVMAVVETLLDPEALLFDMDGVLIDVSRSYRQAIEQTVSAFGGRVSAEDIEACKRQGQANNDWIVCQRLLEAQSIQIGLESIRECFDSLVWGKGPGQGLYKLEKFIGNQTVLRELAENIPCAIVTGRPRRDAFSALERFGLRDLFSAVICMEDAPVKPSPEPVRQALKKLGVQRAWMIGDTPDDMVASREAGVLPFGVRAPNTGNEDTTQSLLRAGAAQVGDLWEELLKRLQ